MLAKKLFATLVFPLFLFCSVYAQQTSGELQEYEVIESSVEKIELGKRLQGNSELQIPANQYIGLFNIEAGQTIRIYGPYSGPVMDYSVETNDPFGAILNRLKGSSTVRGECGTKEGVVRGDC